MVDAITNTSGALPIELAVNDQGLIGTEVRCIGCRYNLRGLEQRGDCPECGLSVQRSLQGGQLICQTPAWLKRVALGALWSVFGHAGWVADLLLMWLVTVFVSVAMQRAGRGDTDAAAQVLCVIFGALMALTMIVQLSGNWLFTLPPIYQLDTAKRLVSRPLARWGLIISKTVWLVGYALTMILLLVDPGSGAPVISTPLWGLIGGSFVLSGMGWFIGAAAMLIYQRQISLRVPQQTLASHWRYLLIFFISGWVVVIGGYIAVVVTAVLQNTAHATFVVGAIVFVCLWTVIALGIWVWELILLIWLYRSLAALSRQAAATHGLAAVSMA